MVDDVDFWYNGKVEDPTAEKFQEHIKNFCENLNIFMGGLLKPEGQLLEELGGENLTKSLDKLCESFRILLELSVFDAHFYYDGSYSEENIQKVFKESKIILKNNYWV